MGLARPAALLASVRGVRSYCCVGSKAACAACVHDHDAVVAYLQEARQFAALAEQMLMRRQQKQRGHMLHWWHLIAQDLHHHR